VLYCRAQSFVVAGDAGSVALVLLVRWCVRSTDAEAEPLLITAGSQPHRPQCQTDRAEPNACRSRGSGACTGLHRRRHCLARTALVPVLVVVLSSKFGGS
jgi:hypothetical protein